MGICYTAVLEKFEFVFGLNSIVFEFNVPRTISSIKTATITRPTETVPD